MLFNSFEFLLFLPIVFALYWGVFGRSVRGQNVWLLVASYVFYGWWDYRFLGLIVLSTLVDFVVGRQLAVAREYRRRLWLALSLCVNIGLLGFFKYYNFFVDSWVDAWASLGVEMHRSTLQIILPVGISFYTFQTLSYSIDIYRRKLKPADNFIDFAAFVSFFPQLVAGPIERATNLLPQIQMPRTFRYAQGVAGMRLILWGMFKKVVIADTLAPFVDEIFANYDAYPGSVLVLGALYFSIQIYCDFSGYSDIAIGTAKLFGIELMSNFRFPYFARDIAEFWRRWHISLSTWFRDYLYIPIGGSRVSRLKVIRNVFVIFLVSGFWHGANWTFIWWGGIHAFLFIPVLLLNINRRHTGPVVAHDRMIPGFREGTAILFTFTMVTLAWVFFRAESVGQAFGYLGALPNGLLQLPTTQFRSGIPWVIVLLVCDWVLRRDERTIRWSKIPVVRHLIYLILLFFVLARFSSDEAFIYFQF